jgi:hypothetical protein
MHTSRPVQSHILRGGRLTPLVIRGSGPSPAPTGFSFPDSNPIVTDTLLSQKGTHDHLSANGQSAQAERVLYLFENSSAKFGWTQFERNLHMARALNAKNAADSNNKKAPYEVEHALALTLQNNGIFVPVSFLLTINKDFKPSYPPGNK